MLEATPIHTTAGPVVDNHLLAQEALCLLGDHPTRSHRRANHMIRGLTAKALATRATSVAELRFRLCTLLETLEHEEASDYAAGLCLAALADLDLLAGGGPRASAMVRGG